VIVGHAPSAKAGKKIGPARISVFNVCFCVESVATNAVLIPQIVIWPARRAMIQSKRVAATIVIGSTLSPIK
jgi:hypothetical protein